MIDNVYNMNSLETQKGAIFDLQESDLANFERLYEETKA